MDDAGIGFLLMLRRNMGITDAMLEEHAEEIRSSLNYIADRDQYAKSFMAPLFDGDERERCFHIIWDPVLETRHRRCLFTEIDNAEKRIRKLIERKTKVSMEEAQRYSNWFTLKVIESGKNGFNYLVANKFWEVPLI